MDEEKIAKHFKDILLLIGENPERKELIDTPKRVAKMYKEIFRGYDISKTPKITTFDNDEDGVIYDEMIIDTGKGWSHCAHHLASIEFKYFFGYIPSSDGKILGLSKVARVVDYYAAKLQTQERLVNDIINALTNALDGTPLGMGLVIKGKHLCKSMRGVKKDGEMVTIALRGAMRNNPETRAEFLKFVNGD